MHLEKIKHIIFDLGGVIIDIDPQRSYQALQAFASDQKTEISEHADLFLDYEKGIINSSEFRQGIRQLTQNTTLTDAQIDEAWNQMLLHIPEERIAVLRKLKDRFSLYVLSNTNDIHVPAFNAIVERVCGEAGIHCFFDKVYFSHDLKMRKPEPDIYRHVLEENKLKPEETLFVDDRYENIAAAAALGIQTYHVHTEQDMIALFERL